MSEEWVSAFDDLLVERIRGCTHCGNRLHRMATGVLCVDDSLCISYAWCQRCLDRFPDREVLEQTLAQRYQRQEDT